MHKINYMKKTKIQLLDEEKIPVIGKKELLNEDDDEDPNDGEDPESEGEEPEQPEPEFEEEE